MDVITSSNSTPVTSLGNNQLLEQRRVTCGRDSRLSLGPGGQKSGQTAPSRSLGGFLKPFLGSWVDRNQVRRVQGKQMMLFLRKQMCVPNVCSCVCLNSWISSSFLSLTITALSYCTFNIRILIHFMASLTHLHMLVLGWLLYRAPVLNVDGEIQDERFGPSGTPHG